MRSTEFAIDTANDDPVKDSQALRMRKRELAIDGSGVCPVPVPSSNRPHPELVEGRTASMRA